MFQTLFARSTCSSAPSFINGEQLKSIMDQGWAQTPICFTSSAWLSCWSTELATWRAKGQHLGRKETKVLIVSEEVKSLEFKVAFGAVPMSGRGENIMIEKWYQPLLPVGRLQANTLCFKERLFQCIYLSMVELSPACHSVCHAETKILYVCLCRHNLHCSVKTSSHKHDWQSLFH